MAWGYSNKNTESDKVKEAVAAFDAESSLYFLYENEKFLFVTDDMEKVDTTVAFMNDKNLQVFVSVNKKSERIF